MEFSAVLKPFHLLAYSTLVGTQLYQSFVMTKICYQVLPTSAFTSLQKKVFPAYFKIQSLLVAATIVSYPPQSIRSLIASPKDLLPLALTTCFGVLNLAIYGPRTKQAMITRTHQETTDGKKFNDVDISVDMRAKNRAFSRNHAMSIHLNLLAMITSLWYGFNLAGRMRF